MNNATASFNELCIAHSCIIRHVKRMLRFHLTCLLYCATQYLPPSFEAKRSFEIVLVVAGTDRPLSWRVRWVDICSFDLAISHWRDLDWTDVFPGAQPSSLACHDLLAGSGAELKDLGLSA